jgi:hypothetical protein
MEGGSPSRRSKKQSKLNQDRTATKSSGRTKAAYLRDDTGAPRRAAARAHGGRGSSSAAPPPPLAQAFGGMDPVVDVEEEALERAGCTIGVPVLQSPSRGPSHPVHEFVLFDGPPPFIREPKLAPNFGGWAPPHPVDYRHNVREIRLQRARNLYAKEEKDLWLEARLWHPFHFDYYRSILYSKVLKKKEPVIQMKYILSYDLGLITEPPELPQMVKDLNSMGLLRLMEFRKHWNNEIILQFYASYHHEKDKIGATDIIH